MLTALICVALFAYGGFWGMVRDQDWVGPDKPAGAGDNPYKEVGNFAVGLPVGALFPWIFGPTLDAILAGVGAWLLTAGAWSLQHAVTSYVTGRPERAIRAQNAEDLINLTLGGALVTLGPALALVWMGRPLLAIPALLFGAAKAGTYLVAWRVRPVPGKRPEATFLGHVAHGALAVSGSGACVLLAG